MLQPTRLKYRKQQKGRNTGIATRGNKVSFGDFGLKAIGRGRLTARQIEAARRAMTRHIKRGGRIWIRVFPDKPITSKPAWRSVVPVATTSATQSAAPKATAFSTAPSSLTTLAEIPSASSHFANRVG